MIRTTLSSRDWEEIWGRYCDIECGCEMDASVDQQQWQSTTRWRADISKKCQSREPGRTRGLYRSFPSFHRYQKENVFRGKCLRGQKDFLSQEHVRVTVWHHCLLYHRLSGKLCVLMARGVWLVEREKDGTPGRPPLRKHCLHETPSKRRPTTNRLNQKHTDSLSGTR